MSAPATAPLPWDLALIVGDPAALLARPVADLSDDDLSAAIAYAAWQRTHADTDGASDRYDARLESLYLERDSRNACDDDPDGGIVYDIGEGDVVKFPDGYTVTIEAVDWDETGGTFFTWTDPKTGEGFFNYASELLWDEYPSALAEYPTAHTARVQNGIVEVTGPDGTDAGSAILFDPEGITDALAGLGYRPIGRTLDEDGAPVLTVQPLTDQPL